MGVNSSAAGGSGRTRVILLVTAMMFINYIDRGSLAIAAPLMQDQLHLTASQIGILLSAFYYTYVLATPAAGWLAEKYGSYVVLALGTAIWSLATFATGFATSFAMLLAVRLLLGLGESASFPGASKVLVQVVEPRNLGVANGVMSCGYLLGPVVGTLAGGLLMDRFGWRPMFIVFGVVSAAWLIPWRTVRFKSRLPSATEQPPSLRRILKERSLWGTSIGLFSANYGFYFILAWLPFYLVKERGFSVSEMAWLASWAYFLNAVSALLMGWFADKWLRDGRSANLVYKGVMALNQLGGIACMIAMVTLSARGMTIALFLYEILAGLSAPGIYAIPQIIAGPTAAGRWVGIQNCIGNMAGLVAPLLSGILVDRTGQFLQAFVLAAIVNIIGLFAWTLMIPDVSPLSWKDPEDPAQAGDGAKIAL